ncbi:MAG TPA: hypothetical protein V6D19_15145 [Stenomitos sp.]
MINEWLDQQGLLSVKQLWMKVQGYVELEYHDGDARKPARPALTGRGIE